jgi:hypothetical protein
MRIAEFMAYDDIDCSSTRYTNTDIQCSIIILRRFSYRNTAGKSDPGTLMFYHLYDLETFFFQAQRDYFGAHTYELLSNPGTFVHTDWTGTGGRVTSNAYSA